MTRLLLTSIAVISALVVLPYALNAQQATPKKGAPLKLNQVYVKIILPTDPANRDKDRPVVETWIAEQLKKRGQSKFTAATAWVRLADKGRLDIIGSHFGRDGGWYLECNERVFAVGCSRVSP